jgi:hypothetical protein
MTLFGLSAFFRARLFIRQTRQSAPTKKKGPTKAKMSEMGPTKVKMKAIDQPKKIYARKT